MKKALFLVFGVLISLFLLQSVHATSITYPLNNSVLNANQVYNFSLYETQISTTQTSANVEILVNNSVVYDNTLTANGVYHIPIDFYNSGIYSVKLIANTNSTLFYSVHGSSLNSLYDFWTDYNFILIIYAMTGAIALIVNKYFKKSKRIGFMAISVIFAIVSMYALIFSISVNSQFAYVMILFSAVIMALSLVSVFKAVFEI
jgi:hypothetical protein